MDRFSVYGLDAEDKPRRMFDLIVHNGLIYIETKDRGHTVRIPLSTAIESLEKFQRQAQHQ